MWNSTGQKLTPWSKVIPEKQVSNRTRKYVYPAVEVQRIPRTCFVRPLLVKVSHVERRIVNLRKGLGTKTCEEIERQTDRPT